MSGAIVRWIVVLGASSGGIEALSRVLSQLPADLPAAVFIVQHTSPSSPALLASVLGRQTSLPTATATDGEPIESSSATTQEAVRALWVALRTLDERARMMATMERSSREAARPLSADHFALRHEELHNAAASVRALIRTLTQETAEASPGATG